MGRSKMEYRAHRETRMYRRIPQVRSFSGPRLLSTQCKKRRNFSVSVDRAYSSQGAFSHSGKADAVDSSTKNIGCEKPCEFFWNILHVPKKIKLVFHESFKECGPAKNVKRNSSPIVLQIQFRQRGVQVVGGKTQLELF